MHPMHGQLRQTILFLSGLLTRILLKLIRRDEDVDFAQISNDIVDGFGRLEPYSDLSNFWLLLEPIQAHVVEFQVVFRLKRRVLDVEGGDWSKIHLPEPQGGLVCIEVEVILQGGNPFQVT
jgi:hypothetical protein